MATLLLSIHAHGAHVHQLPLSVQEATQLLLDNGFLLQMTELDIMYVHPEHNPIDDGPYPSSCLMLFDEERPEAFTLAGEVILNYPCHNLILLTESDNAKDFFRQAELDQGEYVLTEPTVVSRRVYAPIIFNPSGSGKGISFGTKGRLLDEIASAFLAATCATPKPWPFGPKETGGV